MKKQILLVIDNLGSGGAQNQLSLLAVGLKNKGYKVSVFVYYSSDFFIERLLNNNIKIFKKLKKDRLGVNVLLELKKILNESSYDCMISFLDTPNFYAVFANKLSRSKVKHIVSYRSMTDFDKINYFKLKQFEWVNKNASVIISNSFHEKERWVKKYPYLKNKFDTIYNCIDNSIFYPKNNSKRNNDLLVVGSISQAKNGMVVLKALKLLIEQGMEINIHWVGRKDMHIKERREYYYKMNNYIENNSLGNYWKWIEPRQNINELYHSYKALILPSTREGLPNVVCEAQCCGMPCILSHVLDHDRLVVDNVSGYLFNPSKPEDLVKKIKSLYSLNNNEYEKMINNNIELNEDKFSFNQYVNLYLSKCND